MLCVCLYFQESTKITSSFWPEGANGAWLWNAEHLVNGARQWTCFCLVILMSLAGLASSEYIGRSFHTHSRVVTNWLFDCHTNRLKNHVESFISYRMMSIHFIQLMLQGFTDALVSITSRIPKNNNSKSHIHNQMSDIAIFGLLRKVYWSWICYFQTWFIPTSQRWHIWHEWAARSSIG